MDKDDARQIAKLVVLRSNENLIDNITATLMEHCKEDKINNDTEVADEHKGYLVRAWDTEFSTPIFGILVRIDESHAHKYLVLKADKKLERFKFAELASSTKIDLLNS